MKMDKSKWHREGNDTVQGIMSVTNSVWENERNIIHKLNIFNNTSLFPFDYMKSVNAFQGMIIKF